MRRYPLMFYPLHLSPDPVEGAPAGTKPSTIVDRYVAKYGSLESACAILAQDLMAANATADTATNLANELRLKVPAAGSTIVKTEDATELTAFRALNLSPAKLTEALAERDALKGKVTAQTVGEQARAAAQAVGFDPDAFAAMVAAKGLAVEMRDTQMVENGKTVTKSMPYVRVAANEKDPMVAAAEYAGKLPAFEQRALKPGAPGPTPAPGVLFVPTAPTIPGTGTDPKTGVLAFREKIEAEKRQRPNPLVAPPKPVLAGATV